MDRRNFLKVSALGAGALAAKDLTAKKKETVVEVKTPLKVESYVVEPAKRIPVVASVDIVVVGGGPAGVAAAVSAARQGAGVMLVEKNNYLGGLWTGGLVLPLNNNCGLSKAGKIQQSMGGFGEEIRARLKAMKMTVERPEGRDPRVDPEATKYLLDMAVMDSGVRMLYHSYVTGVQMSGDRIDTLFFESKSGRCAIRTKMVVDCSGDGDIIEWCGESFEKRTESIGMMWRAGGITDSQNPRLTPVSGVINMHMVGEKDQDGLDVFNLSRLQQKFRKVMWDRTMEERKKIGCEAAYVLETPSMLGVRITRVLNSMHNVEFEDYKSFKAYDDVVGLGGTANARRPVWQIPYRSLVPRTCPNLLVAGRCFGFEKGLTYDAREIATCLVTGQSAGTAAALALAGSTSVQTVDVPKLQSVLKAAGVIFA